MRKVRIPVGTVLDDSKISELIQNHHDERQRILKMKKYYKNDNVIMRRVYLDKNKPQNRLAHPYASYITNTAVGYFIGKPVSYKSDNENLLNVLNEAFLYNDEPDVNTTLAKEVSICGYGYEILFTDSDGEVRFKPLPTEEVIAIYDNTLEENLIYAIRYFSIDERKEAVEVYSKDDIKYYIKEGNSVSEVEIEIKKGNYITKASSTEHYFKQVPIVEYINNDDRIGDFENVISLIDAYDKANSDTANDFEYFTDALLVISGVTMDEEDEEGRPLNFKENRVINFLDPNSKAEYLIKNINDTALENYKNRLNQDIIRFANTIDISDENFANNLSGVAMKYKLLSLENITSVKESKFRKGLMRRIELLTTLLSIKANNLYLYTEIKPVFTRNTPVNEVELVNMAKSLNGIVSEDTLLSILPFIDSVQDEKKALEVEREAQAIEYENFNSSDNDNQSKEDGIDE